MGKATIIAHKGAGLYDVAINYDTAAYNRRVAALTATVAEIDGQLTTLAGQIDDAKATKAAALVALNAAIADKKLEPLHSAESKMINATAVLAGLQQTQAMFKARRLAAAKALETLKESPPDDKLIEAWCADASEDLTGVVGTIDPAGVDSGTILHPGFEGQAAYDPARDGLYRMREHMGPAELFYNAAIAAGWQIWKPTYRTGILTAVNGDICSVALDAAALTQQNLNVNVKGEAPETITPVAILENVPIVYMSCNGEAFTVGDTVTVLLAGQSWSGAKVIGFVREPKDCFGGITHINQAGQKAAWSKTENILSEKLMTADRWSAHGNHYWYGSDGTVLSWFGPNGRYSRGPGSFGRVRVGDVICSQLPYPLAFGATFDRVTAVIDETPQVIGASQYGGLWDVATLEGITSTAVYKNGRILVHSKAGSRVCGAWIYKGVVVTASAYMHGTLFEAHNLTTNEKKELLYQEHLISFSAGTNGVPMGDRVIRAEDNTTPWRAKGDGSIAKVERYVTTWEGESQSLQIFFTATMVGEGWNDISVSVIGTPPVSSTTVSLLRSGDWERVNPQYVRGYVSDSSSITTAVITDYYMDEVMTATVTTEHVGTSKMTDYRATIAGFFGLWYVTEFEDTASFHHTVAVTGGPTLTFSATNRRDACAPGWGGGFDVLSTEDSSSGDLLCLMDMRFGLYVQRSEASSSSYSSGRTLEETITNTNWEGVPSQSQSSQREWKYSVPGLSLTTITSDSLGGVTISYGSAYAGDYSEDETVTITGSIPVYVEDFNRYGAGKILISPLPYAVQDQRGLLATCFEIWKVVDQGDDPDTVELAATVNLVDGVDQNLTTSPLPIGVV